MDHVFRELMEGLKQTAEGLVMANEGIKRVVDAALAANGEQQDLRETVARLESLILDLSRRVPPPPGTEGTQ